MASRRVENDEARRAPGIPGMTVNEEASIRGDTPDEPASDDNRDVAGDPLDAEEGPLAVTDDDTVGTNEADDDERWSGATEAARSDRP